jgi:hypothetical protein
MRNEQEDLRPISQPRSNQESVNQQAKLQELMEALRRLRLSYEEKARAEQRLDGFTTMEESQCEVLPAGKLRAKYGLTAENRPVIILNPANVPPELRPLIPLAELFGIGDDLIREDVVARTPASEVEAIRRAVLALDDAFDAWLAGPEANGSEFSDEYLAFSNLRMAALGC